MLLTFFFVSLAVVPAWHGWGWLREQHVIAELRQFAHVEVKRFEPVGPSKHLPSWLEFLHGRATRVFVSGDPEGRLGTLDLSSLIHLRWIELERCHISDDALAQFEGCTELDLLMLNENPLNGSGLAKLSRCRKLTSLYLSDTRLNDAGMTNIGKLTSVEELYLGRTCITDAGMGELTLLTSLSAINIEGTAVTDAGLLHLRGLKSLRSVIATGTKVTVEGQRELQRLLPNVRIYR